MRQALVSVILPVYNAARYLTQCLDSVLAQDLPDWELIAVDDGSNDASLAILQHYRRRDSRVRVFSIPTGSPGGEGFPCNRALELAKGESIARLDADDWLQPDALSTLYAALMKSRADVAVARYRLADEQGGVYPDHAADDCWRYLAESGEGGVLSAPFHEVLLYLGPVACRNLYRRRFLQHHRLCYPQDDTRAQDHGFHWLCWTHANRAVFVDAEVYNYRRGLAGQLSGARIELLLESYQGVMSWVGEQLERRGMLSDYIYLLELDMLKQVAGGARQLPVRSARNQLQALSKELLELHPTPVRKIRLPARSRLLYWQWLRFCLRRQRPLLALADSPLLRVAHRLRVGAGGGHR